jgi:hypothetical protein
VDSWVISPFSNGGGSGSFFAIVVVAAGLDCDGGGEGEPLVVGVDGAILVRGLSAAGLDDGGGGGDDIED